ncbi:DUF1236 domain-containing protein [Labrys wisconsinensis]|uniref:DUF1236 domain-containing protein n=1 Tax=Labrys wisconsinensis TaxID=425677 RepID=A0ABU0JHM5_9HYPH|nr:DUF1236 domain-containing protein [Labrys wisconsinensis]MDQ0473100.1 hypothetical protein [Labrys wisconsinensis]
MRNMLPKCAIILALLAPVGAGAQGVVGGAANGAERGNDAAGPIGGVVGGAVGAVTGAVNGLLGIDERPRFREYVVREHRPSYRMTEAVEVGAVLPADGVTYYEVPREYGVTRYRYTVVNDEPVLVDPGTHRIVQVVE